MNKLKRERALETLKMNGVQCWSIESVVGKWSPYDTLPSFPTAAEVCRSVTTVFFNWSVVGMRDAWQKTIVCDAL